MSLRKKLQRKWQNLVLKWRWFRATRVAKSNCMAEPIGLNRCDIFYINLDHRIDRRSHIEGEFEKIGVSNYTRIAAIKDENGALGCAQSHLNILRAWDANPQRLLMICEDDCQFLLERSEIDDLVDQFFSDTRLDVLCLGYNARNGVPVTNEFTITSNTQTLSCYIMKPHIVAKLIESALKSTKWLATGLPEQKAAIDVVWKELQTQYMFAIPRNRAAKQTGFYSDIQKKSVSYNV
jgi:hypothetical protein